MKEQEEKIDTIRREIDMVGDTLNFVFRFDEFHTFLIDNP